MKKYHPPQYLRLLHGMFWFFLFSAIISFVLFYGYMISTTSDYLGILCVSLIFIPAILFSPAVILLFPSIGLREKDISLYYTWGKYKSIQWEDVTEIKWVLVPSRIKLMVGRIVPDNAIFVRVTGMGFYFRYFGLLYGGGGAGFIIHPHIGNSEEFSRLFKQYCPHVFPKKQVVKE